MKLLSWLNAKPVTTRRIQSLGKSLPSVQRGRVGSEISVKDEGESWLMTIT
jgi:hypothetical protein